MITNGVQGTRDRGVRRHLTDSTPSVSIGMPVYNGEQYTRQALDSLLAQDHGDFELIISDNASTDGTQAICLEYAAGDQRIRYCRTERNMGASWNFNRAFELSSGEYFMWAGSHDLWAPSFISACKQVLDTDSSVVLAYPRAARIDGVGETIIEVVPEFIDTRGLPTAHGVRLIVAELCYCTMIYGLYRASALRRCRPFQTCLGPDHVLLTEISTLGAIAQIPEVLYHTRDYRPPVTGAERKAITLMRLNPDASKRKQVRPHWGWGLQSLVGAWRVAPLGKKLHLTMVVAHAFYRRWHRALKKDLRRPLSLQHCEQPDY